MPDPVPFSGAAPLRLRPELAELATLTDFIEIFAEDHGLPAVDTYAFTLAAEELFANTLRHCSPPATVVEFFMTADLDSASAVYSDDGPEFDPTALAEADTTLPAEQRRIGGLGIHFIRKSMPVFRYQRRDGRNLTSFGRPRSQKSG